MQFPFGRQSSRSILALITLAMIFFSSSISAAKPKGIAGNTPAGQILYTQFSLFHEGGRHITTNYRKGFLVPVNTEVKFVKATKDEIVVTLPDGLDLRLINVSEFSGEKIDGIFRRTLATEPVDLSQFTEAEKKSIINGEVKNGMRKSAVIVALGYPPKHKTPSLDLNQWRYWQNRFDTFIVSFENDLVIKIYN